MSWLLFAELIAKVGIPLAESIFQKWKQGGEVTQADIDELKAIAAKTAKGQILDAATQLGLSPDDPKVKALLEMVPQPPINPT